MLNRINLNPKNIFLIDGLGALLTAFLLFFVLARFEFVFGMPKAILYFLSLIAMFLSVYSISCHFLVNKKLGKHLIGIIAANTIYCLITIGLLVYFYSKLTLADLLYFISEILVIIILVIIEVKAYLKTVN